MPIDPRRREAIEAAVAAYNGANPLAPLPRNAARLLAAMFLAGDYQAGFLAYQRRGDDDLYQLRIPPVRR